MVDLKLTDLFVKCDKCAGTGHFADGSQSGERGFPKGNLRSEACKTCGGHGGSLTPSGRALADFVDVLRRMGRS